MVIGRSGGVSTVANREVVASFALLASLVALGRLTTLGPLGTPGTLLVEGYELVEAFLTDVVAVSAPTVVLFLAYLYVLAVGVAWFVRNTGKS
ncbi:hypothetical protein [Haloarchaeobius salinus]|uniref:hypothetical protein n=1 Tax=Haloarchaeobius salinus TaxID=1198298 RepID=UPI00210905CF|nr:hypothetical protein [Haloarchaeobius salinus]